MRILASSHRYSFSGISALFLILLGLFVATQTIAATHEIDSDDSDHDDTTCTICLVGDRKDDFDGLGDGHGTDDGASGGQTNAPDYPWLITDTFSDLTLVQKQSFPSRQCEYWSIPAQTSACVAAPRAPPAG